MLIESISKVILHSLETGIPDKYQHIQTGTDFDINPNKWTSEQEIEQSKRVFTKRDRWMDTGEGGLGLSFQKFGNFKLESVI